MKYIYDDKPVYNPETEVMVPDYKIENGTFIAGWKVERKPDEDGYVPTPDEQPEGAPTIRERVDKIESALEALISEGQNRK